MAAGLSGAGILRAPRSRFRGSEARVSPSQPRPQNSAGPPSGRDFHREDEWSLTNPAARPEIRNRKSRAGQSSPLDQPALAAAGALGNGLSCRFDQEM